MVGLDLQDKRVFEYLKRNPTFIPEHALADELNWDVEDVRDSLANLETHELVRKEWVRSTKTHKWKLWNLDVVKEGDKLFQINGDYLQKTKFGVKVITGLLGEKVMQEYHFVTMADTHEVFVYQDGVYVPGENIINSRCQELVGSEHIKTVHGNEAISYIQRATYTEREKFDEGNNIINLKNGLFDIKNKKLHPHTHEYLSLIQIPIEYDEGAECPLWDSYLKTTLPTEEDIKMLQEVAGYVFMDGYTINKAIVLEGAGGNGKSVYLETIANMIGKENVSSVSWQELGEDKYAKAKLYGKLANINNDLPATALSDTGAFKQLTTGELIWSDIKFSVKGISFRNRSKIMYAANRIPRTKDMTDAFFDRLLIINFPYKIRGTKHEDKTLKKRLMEELPGIFNWAIVGLHRLFENESFSSSKTVEDYKSMFLKKSDSVFAFFSEIVREGEKGSKISKQDVYQNYVSYCKRFLNVEPLTIEMFGRLFPKNAGWIGSGQRWFDVDGEEERERVNCWIGIRLKDLPGKQNTILFKNKSIVQSETTPKNTLNTILTILNFPIARNICYSCPGRGKKTDKMLNKLTTIKEKSIVSIDLSNQKARLFFLLRQIKSRQKANDKPVKKSELLDEYQLKKYLVEQLNQDILRLKQDGQIYEPYHEEYLIV